MLSKRDTVDQALKDGKTVSEISQEFDISKSYIYQLKRKNNKPSRKILDVTSIIKKETFNNFYLNGFNIKCNDDILMKIIKGLSDD
jgi:hypothetical protein